MSESKDRNPQLRITMAPEMLERIKRLGATEGITTAEAGRTCLFNGLLQREKDFRQATGKTVEEACCEMDGVESIEDVSENSALVILSAIVSGEEPDAKALVAVAKKLRLAPHELSERLRKKEGNGHAVSADQ